MRTLSGVTALACGALLSLSVPATASAAAPPTCFGQPATIVGTTGDDTLSGTTGPDVIVGLSGNDTISGLDADDRLCGGTGADTLVGGDGDDHLSGGRDFLEDVTDDGDFISFGDDLDGGAGNDELDPGWDPGHHEFDGWVGDVIRFPGSTVGPPEGLTIDLGAGTAVGQGDDTLDLADTATCR
jgi:Ca2+-binding RTX toxin-like protein